MLNGTEGHNITHNFRLEQALNGRHVYHHMAGASSAIASLTLTILSAGALYLNKY